MNEPEITSSRCIRASSLSPLHASNRPNSKSKTRYQWVKEAHKIQEESSTKGREVQSQFEREGPIKMSRCWRPKGLTCEIDEEVVQLNLGSVGENQLEGGNSLYDCVLL